jgi:hypothetical protein
MTQKHNYEAGALLGYDVHEYLDLKNSRFRSIAELEAAPEPELAEPHRKPVLELTFSAWLQFWLQGQPSGCSFI